MDTYFLVHRQSEAGRLAVVTKAEKLADDEVIHAIEAASWKAAREVFGLMPLPLSGI